MTLGTTLIVFRETLEAAMFVGIVAAATTHLARRGRWLAIGIVAGILGSIAVAASMEAITAWSDGLGQDLFTALLLGMAISFLAWHAIDAPRHALQLRSEAKRIGMTTTADTRSMLALTVAVGLAVLREGAETALFIAGTASSGANSMADAVLSVVAGFALGATVGWLLYLGLGLFNPRRLFAITNTLILLLAGALTSQLVLTLSQANWMNILGNKAWDISGVLPNDSALGTLLHGLVGYDASPTQAQLLGYIAAIALIATAARTSSKRRMSSSVANSPARAD